MEVIKKDLKEIEQMVIDNTKKIEENSKKIDNNVDRIIKNMDKLHNHDEQIKENSFALEILKDMKNNSNSLSEANKRLCNIILILSIILFVAIGTIIFLLVK